MLFSLAFLLTSRQKNQPVVKLMLSHKTMTGLVLVSTAMIQMKRDLSEASELIHMWACLTLLPFPVSPVCLLPVPSNFDLLISGSHLMRCVQDGDWRWWGGGIRDMTFLCHLTSQVTHLSVASTGGVSFLPLLYSSRSLREDSLFQGIIWIYCVTS